MAGKYPERSRARAQLAEGWRDGKQLARENTKGALRIVSLVAANLLGVGAGMMLGTLMGIPAAEDRTWALFALGAVNGWVLHMLWGAITGRRRRRRKKR